MSDGMSEVTKHALARIIKSRNLAEERLINPYEFLEKALGYVTIRNCRGFSYEKEGGSTGIEESENGTFINSKILDDGLDRVKSLIGNSNSFELPLESLLITRKIETKEQLHRKLDGNYQRLIIVSYNVGNEEENLLNIRLAYHSDTNGSWGDGKPKVDPKTKIARWEKIPGHYQKTFLIYIEGLISPDGLLNFEEQLEKYSKNMSRRPQVSVELRKK